MNQKEALVEILMNSSLCSDFAHAFTDATSLPVALRPLETWRMPLRGKRRENPFCALMACKSRTCAPCLQTQEKLAQSAREGPSTVTCPYGLAEMAVPVKVGNRTIGFLQTGQVFLQKPTNAQCVRMIKNVEQTGSDLDPENLTETFFKTPVVSRTKMDAAAQLLTIFAEHLSMKCNQLAVQQANGEPPVITRSKQYILEHLKEDLSLGQVAGAVHTSVFYFCKLFRKTTGITFTEFVHRARTERARNLLLNPNLRISEIAYEAGFQSLTHFNRTFKTIVGESPTSYRRRLHNTTLL